MKLSGDRCQCTVCNKYFKSTLAFDAHRVDGLCEDRRCLNDKEMLKNGMGINDAGFWVTQLWDASKSASEVFGTHK